MRRFLWLLALLAAFIVGWSVGAHFGEWAICRMIERADPDTFADLVKHGVV